MTSVTSRGPSLGRRLTAAFGATLCLALFGSGYGAYALNESAAQTRTIVEQDVVTELRGLLDRELVCGLQPAPSLFDRLLRRAALESPSFTIRGGTNEVLRSVAAKGLS